MLLLDNPIQAYAWGRPDGLHHLVGCPPSGGPEAELWVGSHPVAPSTVAATGQRLDEVVAADPRRWLGSGGTAADHGALPFLLKVLAIGQPLSLQAHPTEPRARIGFAAEQAAGLALDDPARCFRDPNGKPEALVALEPTWAMAGFRPASQAAELVAALGLAVLDPVLDALRTRGSHAALGALLHLSPADRAQVAAAVGAAVGPGPRDGWEGLDPADPTTPQAVAALLARSYPTDPTIVAPLLLATFRLDVGEAVYLPPGQLHAYLHGAGVELMASSDNVLRGGLTPKHVDVDALLDVVAPVEAGPCRITPRPVGDGLAYDLAPGGLQLGVSAARPTPRTVLLDDRPGPALLLPTGGAVVASDGHGSRLELGAGQAVLVPAGHGPVAVEGPGTLWWACGAVAAEPVTAPGTVGEAVVDLRPPAAAPRVAEISG